MDIVYFSKGIRGAKCLKYILRQNYTVKAIVAVEDEDTLRQISKDNGIPIFIPEKVNSRVFADQLESFRPDLFVLSGYNRIIRPVIIDIPPLGTINLHGGRLPEYRGAAPINWQIINGETIGGCSIIYVDEGIDTGDIIRQEYYRITKEDTHESVLQKTLEIFPSLLVKVLEDVESGAANRTPQSLTDGSYYTRRYPRDSKIDWKRMTDVEVHNLVRGMHGPYPSAYTFRGETKVEIERTELLPETIKGTPGRVPLRRGEGVVVLARNRGLLVHEMVVDGAVVAPAEVLTIGDDLE